MVEITQQINTTFANPSMSGLHRSSNFGFRAAAAPAGLWLLCCGFLLSAPAVEWPQDWPIGSPEGHGFSSASLEALWTGLKARHTTALLVIRDDQIIFERYADGFSRTKPHYTASMAKALVGGVSLMLAMDEGRVRPDDLVCKFVPQWTNGTLKTRITLRHLATHTSGVEDAEEGELPHNQLTGWKGDFWKQPPPPRDPFTLARDVAPVLDPPGTRERYSNPGMAMLSYCLTSALRGATNSDLRALLRHRVMAPLGVPAEEWSVGYGTSVNVDGLSLVAPWGGGSYSPNGAARVGRLLLHRGNWNGRQLIPSQVVEEATAWAGMAVHSGLGWWVNRNPDGTRFWACLPIDAFYGAGAGHQFLLVVPSLNLIVVRNGDSLDPSASFNDGLRQHLVDPLMSCLSQPDSPLPSPVIKQIDWAPKETIVRKAKGSDNWPVTWADDDALYTAYGDGNGFEPYLPLKLSLGLAKVVGIPPDFSGFNLSSPGAEQVGDGPRGRKASGLLMVDGVLYLWARNAANSELAWSGDHAATWTWNEWRFTNSFGCPSFLNFGRNYAQARDNFVYVFSPDSESAYAIADRLVLARVPKDQIPNRGAYEFFVRMDDGNQPEWTRDIRSRGAVFACPGRCYRANVSYDAGLKRYLLVMPVPTARSRDGDGRVDTRASGGLSVYDAPEPWGPWTTAFFTEQWDVGPGDSASFPTKWMSPDGRTLCLVFSGDDSFSVRQATIR